MKHSMRTVLAALAVATVPLFASSPVLAEGVPVEAASDAQKRAAIKTYKQGVAFFNAKKFEQGLEMFRGSYEKVASPNSRLMIGRALAKLERYPEAYQELVATIVGASELAPAIKKYHKTIQAAHAELADVSAKVALVQLKVDGKVTVNAEPVEASAWQQVRPVVPGDTKFTYELSNGQRVEKSVVLEAGKTTAVELFSPPLPVPSEATSAQPATTGVGTTDPNSVSYENLAWASAGLGAGGFLAFTVFGLLNNGQFSDLEADCAGKRCSRDLAEDAETGRTYQTLANVGLGVALVGGASAAYFFLAQKNGSVARSRGQSERASNPETELVVGTDRVVIRGRF